MSSEKTYTYQAFGMVIASSRPLSATPFDKPGMPADVTIRYGEVPRQLSEKCTYKTRKWACNASELLIDNEPGYRYLIRHGNEVIVEPRASDQDSPSCHLLHATVWGALLHQRGMMALHASSVLGPDGVWVIMGHSGQGKSSTAAELIKRGHRMLSDDITVVRPADNSDYEVMPAFPVNRLWQDTYDGIDFDSDNMTLSKSDTNKYDIQVNAFSQQSARLSKIFLLNPRDVDEVSVKKLDKHLSFKALVLATYRKRIAEGMSQTHRYLRNLDQLSSQYSVIEVTRPNTSANLAEGLTQVADIIESC